MAEDDSKMRAGRRGARYGAVQGIYRNLMNQIGPTALCKEVAAWEHLTQADAEYLQSLLQGVLDQRGELEESLENCTDRPVAQLDPMERAILLVGAYELRNCLELNRRIPINEAVELAKLFGGDQAHRYVNGVLDKLAKQLRPNETS